MPKPTYEKEDEYPGAESDDALDEAIEETTEEDITSSREMAREAEGYEQPRTGPEYAGYESEPEPEPEPAPKPKKKLGTGEKIYLYISSSPGVYSLAEQTFDSRIEAGQWAEENYGDTPYQTMSASEVKVYVAKLQKQQEQMEKAKKKVVSGAKTVGRGLKRVGGGMAKASEAMAQRHGMTRPQVQRRIQPQSGINISIGSGTGMMPRPGQPLQQQRPEQPRTTRYGRPLQPLRTPRSQPYKPPEPFHPKRMSMQPPQPQRSRFHMPLTEGQPYPQRTKRFNIPAEGPFKSRYRQPSEQPFQSRLQPRDSPIKSKKFDFGGGLHIARPHFVGGRDQPRTPQAVQEAAPAPIKKKKKIRKPTKKKTKKKSKKKGAKKK